MRVLLLMRGAMGCGKSTWIEQNGLKPYTLCADDIRLLCQAPVLDIDGTRKVSQKNEKVVWRTLFDILETRMKRGEFTVIDATNTKTSEMSRYKDLAKKYRYRIYCVDMTDVPIEVAKSQNAKRDPIKFVPEEAIDRAYARFANQKIPSGIKVIKPNELDTIWYKSVDLSSYDKVHIIGDIHGCYTALKRFMDSVDVNANEYFIFLGDYLDRGLENVETIEYLMELQRTHNNVYFLEGNHEAHLRNWANGEEVASNEFKKITQAKLDAAGVNKKDVRNFCRSLGQCSYFTYGDVNVLVTHGGLSTMPSNLTFIATEQIIKGVGDYKDSHDVDQAFLSTTADNFYQVHGHRNETNEFIQVNEAAFNLNGDVEFGGHLRVVTFYKSHNGMVDYQTHEIKNDVYRLPENISKSNDEIANSDIASVIEYMRASKFVNEKSFGNISSFNFTRQAFDNKEWDGITTKARGLYIDTKHNEMVSFVFEVIDKERDPHIIKYKNNECVLLDIINNDIKFNKYPYETMCEVADNIGLKYKYLADTINDYKELSRYIENASSPDFAYQTNRIDDKCIEGYDFEDANGFMFKLKTPYYNEWKMLRSAAIKIFRSGNINFTGALQSVESNYFYGWCREKFVTLTKQERWDYSKRNIISLRDEFRLDKSQGV